MHAAHEQQGQHDGHEACDAALLSFLGHRHRLDLDASRSERADAPWSDLQQPGRPVAQGSSGSPVQYRYSTLNTALGWWSTLRVIHSFYEILEVLLGPSYQPTHTGIQVPGTERVRETVSMKPLLPRPHPHFHPSRRFRRADMSHTAYRSPTWRAARCVPQRARDLGTVPPWLATSADV